MEARPPGAPDCFRPSGYAIGAVGSILLVGGLVVVAPWVVVVLVGMGSLATGPVSGALGFMAAWAPIRHPGLVAAGVATSVIGSVLLAGAAWLTREHEPPFGGGAT